MSGTSAWGLPTDSDLQTALDRVVDGAVQKVVEQKVTEPEGRSWLQDRRSLRLGRASAEDQPAIEALFEKLPISLSGLDVVYDRSPDFFSLLKARGSASAALTARLTEPYGSSRDLLGLGSISVRDGFYNQASVRVAHLGDLRVLLSRSTARVWRQLYNQLLNDVSSELGVESFLTAIVGDNTAALRSLVTRRRSDFLYEPLGRLRLLGIFGRWNFLAKSQLRFDARRVLVGPEAELDFQDFYARRAATLRHGWTKIPAVGTPVVLKNHRGEIRVIARLVCPDPMKRLRIQSMDWSTRAILQALRGTGGPELKVGTSLSTKYLSWVSFDSALAPVERRHVLIELIEACLEDDRLKVEFDADNTDRHSSSRRRVLIVPDSVGLSLRELGGRFHFSTPVELFEVRPDSMGQALDLRNQPVHDIGFEMSLL